MLYILAGSFVLRTALQSWLAPMDVATLAIGKALLPEEIPGLTSKGRGAQDAITPKSQTNIGTVAFCSTVVLVLACLGYNCLLIIPAWFLSVSLGNVLALKYRPKLLAYYLGKMILSLANREADLVKSGDTQRAEAAEHFRTIMENLLEPVHRSAIPLPDLDYVRNSSGAELEAVFNEILEMPLQSERQRKLRLASGIILSLIGLVVIITILVFDGRRFVW